MGSKAVFKVLKYFQMIYRPTVYETCMYCTCRWIGHRCFEIIINLQTCLEFGRIHKVTEFDVECEQ